MKTAENLKRSFYEQNRIRYCLFLALTICDGLANLVVSVLLKEITDAATAGSLERIGGMCLRTVEALAVISAMSVALYHVRSSFLRHAVTGYRKRVMEGILGAERASEGKSGSGLSSLTNDVSVIEDDYLQGAAQIVSNLFFLAAALCLMLWYSPVLTAASLLLMLLPIIISALFGGKLEKEFQAVSDENAKFVKRIQDILRGFPVIKSFHAQEAALKLYVGHNQSLEQAKYRRNIVDGRINLWSVLGSVTTQFGIFLTGGYLAATGKGITIGVLIVFVSLLGQIAGPIGQLPGLIARRRAAGGLIRKAQETLLAEKREPKGGLVPGSIGTISLENVSFDYDGHRALEDVSLRFEQGKSYAIVGESGSGKTTLLRLIMACYDQYSGLITYDDVDARAVDMEALVDHISEIQQNVFIFDATIRENMTMFQEFPEEKVSEALEKAGLGELIRHRGEGYLCGEDGCNLSGGEKQRISIARCFLKDASVLLADEATAALDAETSSHIMSEILGMEQMTRIIVSHKMNPGLLGQYDRIIVMKNGKVRETGTFEELMEQKTYFYSLYNVAN